MSDLYAWKFVKVGHLTDNLFFNSSWRLEILSVVLGNSNSLKIMTISNHLYDSCTNFASLMI